VDLPLGTVGAAGEAWAGAEMPVVVKAQLEVERLA